MKKVLTLLFGGLIALTLFVSTGNTAKAAEFSNQAAETEDDGCSCHQLIPLSGPERNKIVAEFLSSEAFKTQKMVLIKSGYKWNGAHTIEVVIPAEGVTMVGVPFVSIDEIPSVYVFINGTFVGTAPAES